MHNHKIYFSGSFDARDQIKLRATEFAARSLGIVTSNWLREPEVRVEDGREDWVLRARANEDRIDVERSDALVVFTDTPSTTGGRHVEVGIALAHRIPVYVIGPQENVFHYPSDVQHYQTWKEFLEREYDVT
tara:strand:- start:807 stop:1202 length:396 start_codon:yes stop_codon:yes gene_type:complete